MLEIPSFEKIGYFLSVKELPKDDLTKVKKMIIDGRSLAFLVTDNFQIHIGTTGAHKDIYTKFGGRDRAKVVEKGKINGTAKKIYWEVSDSQKDVDLPMEDLKKLQNAIVEKINDYLDLEFYLQSA